MIVEMKKWLLLYGAVYIVNLIMSLSFNYELDIFDILAIGAMIVASYDTKVLEKKERIGLRNLIEADYEENILGYYAIYSIRMIIWISALFLMW